MGHALPRPVLVGIVGTLILSGCAQSSTGSRAAVAVVGSQPATDAVLDKSALSDFQDRVEDYMELHDRLQRQGNRQERRADIGENLVSEQALASRIRLARRDAKPGDILGPPIAAALRRAMNPELRGSAGAGTRGAIGQDAPSGFVLQINGDYPAGTARSTMPGNVLNILPALPDDLQYRIVAPHFVLLDVDANIVVDYLLDVM